MSTLALQLIQKARKEKSKTLDLGRCGLTEIPTEVFDLVWLEELNLCNQYWDAAQQKWINSKNNGQANKIATIPSAIKKLVNIKILWLGGDYEYGREYSIYDPPLVFTYAGITLPSLQ